MINVVPYDRSWPSAYRYARADLLRALGDRLRAIEHTGSTAVPGLSAKPIIDICVATDNRNDFPGADPNLQKIGFESEEYGSASRLFYVKRDRLGERTRHLHVFPVEQWSGLNERMFAAHLRKYPEAANRYSDLKLRRAEVCSDRDAYTRGKTTFIQEMMDAARAERGLPREPVWSS